MDPVQAQVSTSALESTGPGGSAEDQAATGSTGFYAPPKRPENENDLKFERQRPVKWFDPRVLAKSGLRVGASAALGEFLDKRELQRSRQQGYFDHFSAAEDLWFDFIADTGDGFDATYTIAWLASQAKLTVAGCLEELPRGRLLVLGGDEVYPVASADEYEQRFERPYEAALPWIAKDNPELYAIPGNHDWYDGLTSFLRLFCRPEPENWIGARRTRQSRSYFALKLPQKWWLWGIDIQLDSYIDDDQQEYFRKVPLEKDDKVILCTATPSWVDGEDSRSFQNLAYLERNFIRRQGAKLVLSLSGDSHHYARYLGDDGTHKITAGGGGAFTHPTHTLSKDKLKVDVGGPEGPAPQEFTAQGCFPDRKRSLGLSLGAVLLPLRNLWFNLVTGAVYLLLGWSSQFALRSFRRMGPIEDAAPAFGWTEVLQGLFSNPVSVLLLLVFLVGLIGFAKPRPPRPGKARSVLVKGAFKAAMGGMHLLMHIAAVIGLALFAAYLLDTVENGALFTVLMLVAMGVGGGVLGGAVMGLYLAISCLFGGHGNEAFSAMRLTSYKNFLRLHIKQDGSLTVYPIGVRRSVRKWKFDPGGSADLPWLAPDGPPPAPQLIEGPIEIP